MAKNRNKQRENRRRNQTKEEYIGYRNHERYDDPTAFYAINSVIKQSNRQGAFA